MTVTKALCFLSKDSPEVPLVVRKLLKINKWVEERGSVRDSVHRELLFFILFLN